MPDKIPFVIVIDDDTDYLEINRQVLESRDYRVMAFLDPRDALEHMEKERPDLVISDLMMTALDSGFSLSRRVKERFPGVPVIIMTAVGSRRGFDFKPRNAEDLAAMHVDAFFDKSVENETLLAKVRELLNRQEARK